MCFVRCCLKYGKVQVIKLRIAVADDVESDLKRLISAIGNAAEGICEIEYSCFLKAVKVCFCQTVNMTLYSLIFV